MNTEPTNSEILEAVLGFSSEVDGQFQGLREELHDIKWRLMRVESDVGILTSDVGALRSDVVYLKNQMVTKDYLDDKLADLRGDMVALTRKLNVKLSDLVEHLVDEGSIKRNTADL
ncbi:hypothetical protein L0Y59_04645, partial [Candidatus Uhrbacteria bacterium]|nr:hypothetical protein [Candidatus Uhrbacteria bacterium]